MNHRRRSLGLALLMGALLLLLPVVLVDAPLRGGVLPKRDGAVLLLHWTVIAISSIRLASLIYLGEPNWSRVGFWGFVYIWLGLSVYAQIVAGKNPFQTPISDDLLLQYEAVVLLGLLSYGIGGLVTSFYEARPDTDSRSRFFERTILPRRVILLGILTVVLAPVFIASLGGLSSLFGSREAVSDAVSQGGVSAQGGGNAAGGLLRSLANVLPFLAFFTMLRVAVLFERYRKALPFWVLFGLVFLTNLVLNNPISNARYWFLALLLSLLFSIRKFARPTGVALVICAYVLLSSVAFPYLDYFRRDAPAEVVLMQPYEYYLYKTDYGSAADIAYAIELHDVEGATNGQQLAGAILFWVPRSLWSDKPVNTGELIAESIDFPNRNLDSPLWAEGYIDFGYVGVAGFLALFGVLNARVDRQFRLRDTELYDRNRISLSLVFCPVFAGYEAILIRGSLLQATGSIALIVVVLFFLSTGSSRYANCQEADYRGISGRLS